VNRANIELQNSCENKSFSHNMLVSIHIKNKGMGI